jgi:hypothetical protein
MHTFSIANYVTQYLSSNPYILEALRINIVNYVHLADLIKPEIKKNAQKEVQTAAIVMAIRRYVSKIDTNKNIIYYFDKNTNLSMQSDLIELTVYKKSAILEKLKKIHDILNISKKDFISIIYGINEISIIINKKYQQKLAQIFTTNDIKALIKDLSSLTIHNLSTEALDNVGLFYTITRALAWKDIKIPEIVSTYKETSYILDSTDLPQALNVLQEIIKKHTVPVS